MSKPWAVVANDKVISTHETYQLAMEAASRLRGQFVIILDTRKPK